MSIPNSLTILRIALTPLFVVLLFSSSPVLNEVALAVYVIAALTDWYDGWVARRYGYVSRWGKFLDPLADKVLAAAALLSFVYLRLVDAWMVWLIIGRDLVITSLRSYAEWRNEPIVTSKTAQAKTFGEFTVISYSLTLSIASRTGLVNKRFHDLLESLMDRRVLFGMMLLVTLSAFGTGVLYLFDNRKFLRELYARYFSPAGSA